MVSKKKIPIRWDRLAKDNLDAIFDYIAEDSVAAAQKVKKELIKITHNLNDFPEKFSIEEYLADVPGNYRPVSKWNYKIIYEVTE